MPLERQFTSSVYILQKSKVLLIHHVKLEKWLPPGGHLEPNEMPHEAAIREAEEETGLNVEIIKQENVWVEEPNAVSFPRPYLCLLEEIPSYKKVPAHQHVDFIYVAKPTGGRESRCSRQTKDMRWFTWEEAQKIPQKDIFDETRQTLQKIFDSQDLTSI